MTCMQHMKLDLDLGDGFIIPLCARYSGYGTDILRDCGWCCFNSSLFPKVKQFAEALIRENH